MHIYNKFKHKFEQAMEGKGISVPLYRDCMSDELSRLGKLINITNSRYITVYGTSGSGKTSFVNDVFIFGILLKYRIDKNPNFHPYWIYRSMERPSEEMIAKWICYLLYVYDNILIDIPTLFQWSNKKYSLTKEITDKIKLYEKFFVGTSTSKGMLDLVDIIGGAATPDEINKYALNRAYQRGFLLYTKEGKIYQNKGEIVAEFDNIDIEVTDGMVKRFKVVKNGLGEEYKIYENSKIYSPKIKNEIVFHITDHINVLADKSLINTHSANMRKIKDVFGWVCIDVGQMNRNIESVYRKVNTELEVNSSDYKESSSPHENSDISVALFDPYSLGLQEYAGYNLSSFIKKKTFQNRFRVMKLLKNSYGSTGVNICNVFLGENGIYKDIPNYQDLKSTFAELEGVDIKSLTDKYFLDITEGKGILNL